MGGPLLTARHVADLLDVSPATVLRWTRAGDLPAVRLPSGQIRYRPDELEGWLGDRATPGRGVRTTTTDVAHDGRYLPASTDAAGTGCGVGSLLRTTTRGTGPAAEDEESE